MLHGGFKAGMCVNGNNTVALPKKGETKDLDMRTIR